MGNGWTRVDRAVHGGAHNLRERDQCYFYMDRQHGGWDKSEANQLIFNLKKGQERKGCSDWHYKTDAIRKFASDVARLLERFSWHGMRPLLVPMPTSKCRFDESYDDRIVRVSQRASRLSGIDCLEVFDLEASVVAAHFGGSRSLDTIKRNLVLLGEGALLRNYDACLLLDDVLTTGAHFRACKDKLIERFPNLIVIGIFWAKQIPEEYEYGVSSF